MLATEIPIAQLASACRPVVPRFGLALARLTPAGLWIANDS